MSQKRQIEYMSEVEPAAHEYSTGQYGNLYAGISLRDRIREIEKCLQNVGEDEYFAHDYNRTGE